MSGRADCLLLPHTLEAEVGDHLSTGVKEQPENHSERGSQKIRGQPGDSQLSVTLGQGI